MTLKELNDNGTIKFLFDKGFISGEHKLYFSYYEQFETFRNNGKTYRESILLTAIVFQLSESTIKRAVRLIRV